MATLYVPVYKKKGTWYRVKASIPLPWDAAVNYYLSWLREQYNNPEVTEKRKLVKLKNGQTRKVRPRR